LTSVHEVKCDARWHLILILGAGRWWSQSRWADREPGSSLWSDCKSSSSSNQDTRRRWRRNVETV